MVDIEKPQGWVTVVTVSYNSQAVLPQMLASIPEDARVVIVDNASNDRASLRELAKRHGAQLVELDENMGFGVACNIGAAHAGSEYLLFLNPDAKVQPGALDHLRAAAERSPHASAFNPKLMRKDGSVYFRRRSNLLPRSEWLPRGCPGMDREVPVLSGAAIFIRRTDFEAVGGFDPEIFLYYEDDDLSLRLRKQCGPLVFVRAAEVMHIGGASSARSVEVARIKGYHLGRSRVYASVKHGKPWGRTLAVIEALLGAIAPIALVSRRRRAKDWARLASTVRACSEFTRP